jgi:hypothetical protein
LFLAERFLIFLKILKALCLFFFQTFMINLVLTKPSGPKRHAVAFTAPIFAGFCVYYTDLSGGGGADGTGCTTERLSVHGKNTAVYLAIVGLTDL